MTKRIDLLLTVALWLLFFAMFSPYLRGAVQHRYEQTIAPSGYVNPKTFNFGTIKVTPFLVHPTDTKTWTVIQFRPFKTPLLYGETLLFCGDVRKYFQDIGDNFVLLVYSRASSEMVRDSKLPITDTCRAFDSLVVIQPESAFNK